MQPRSSDTHIRHCLSGGLLLDSARWAAGDAALLSAAAPSAKLSAKELPASASSAAALRSCDCRGAPVLASCVTVSTM